MLFESSPSNRRYRGLAQGPLSFTKLLQSQVPNRQVSTMQTTTMAVTLRDASSPPGPLSIYRLHCIPPNKKGERKREKNKGRKEDSQRFRSEYLARQVPNRASRFRGRGTDRWSDMGPAQIHRVPIV